jgi:hypothetical protein
VSGSERLLQLRDRVPEFALIAFILIAGTMAGFLGTRDAKLGGLAVATLVILLLVSRRPVVLAVVAVAGVYAVQRLGATNATPGSGSGVSYSDALVASATIMALPALAGTPELRRLRSAGTAIAVYLALLLPSVLANHSDRVYFEWLHRLVIVGGALLVGAWLVREHAERAALRAFVAVSTVIGALACYDTLSNGLHPASPLQLNKNLIGSLLAVAVVVLLAATHTLRLSLVVRFAAVAVVAGGLLSSQSRGGELAAVLGLLVAFVLDPGSHQRRTKIFAAVVGLGVAVFAGLSIHTQLQQSTVDFRNSSAGVRFNVEDVTHEVWRSSPYVGVGLKYFNAGVYGPYAQAPNNVVDNELAESGLVGLAGFVLLQIGTIAAAVRRRASPLAPVAAGAVAGQLLHGMVDIYWAAGVVTLPFVLLGIALAKSRASATTARRGPTVAAGAHRAE